MYFTYLILSLAIGGSETTGKIGTLFGDECSALQKVTSIKNWKTSIAVALMDEFLELVFRGWKEETS